MFQLLLVGGLQSSFSVVNTFDTKVYVYITCIYEVSVCLTV